MTLATEQTQVRAGLDLIRQAFLLANAAVIADIQSEGQRIEYLGRTWYDLRPMTDLREHCAEVVDMAAAAIRFAVESGLVFVCPDQPHLVRINPDAQRFTGAPSHD